MQATKFFFQNSKSYTFKLAQHKQYCANLPTYLHSLPYRSKFTNYKKEKEDAKFKNMNELYKEYKKSRKFQINTDEAVNRTITEEYIKKNQDQLQNLVLRYLDQYKFEGIFDEPRFVELLSSISNSKNIEDILAEERFQSLLMHRAGNLQNFQSQQSVVAFIQFLCKYDMKNQELMYMVGNYINDHHSSFEFEDRIKILQSIKPENESYFGVAFDLFEEDILRERYMIDDEVNFQLVLPSLMAYRNLNKGSNDFLFTLDNAVKESIKEMPIPYITELTLHYSTAERIDISIKKEIFEELEKRLGQHHVFLNCDQLIVVLYAFIKYGQGTKAFYEIMVDRVLQVMNEFTMMQIEKLIIIYSTRPENAKPVYTAIEHKFKGESTHYSREFKSTMLQNFGELGYGSKELFDSLTSDLSSDVHQMSLEELTKNLLVISETEKITDKSIFFKKAAEYIDERIKQFSGRQFASIVWAFSTERILNSELYENVEAEIYRKLYYNKYGIKDISILLWAYIKRVPLKPYTVALIERNVIAFKERMDAYDASMILWAFSNFKGYPFQPMFRVIQNEVLELIPEMNANELTLALRAYAENSVGKRELYEAFLEKTKESMRDLGYAEAISCLYSYRLAAENIKSSTKSETSIFDEIIEELTEYVKELKEQIEVHKLKSALDVLDGGKQNTEQIDQYLTLEAMQRLKEGK